MKERMSEEIENVRARVCVCVCVRAPTEVIDIVLHTGYDVGRLCEREGETRRRKACVRDK